MLARSYPLHRASFRPLERREESSHYEVSTSFVDLRKQKGRVPAVKEKIGRTNWDKIVSEGSKVSFNSIISRAYFKLDEILKYCAIPLPKKSVHICESPGGFVQCICDAHSKQGNEEKWQWMAISKKGPPYPDFSKLPMHRGTFLDEVDVMDETQAEQLYSNIERGEACLATADGASDMNHADIEGEHFPLLLSQTKIAIFCVKPGGSLVIKFFEGGEQCTLHWIARMTTMFRETSIVKPFTSRSTNSELYFVGKGFVPPEDMEVDWEAPIFPSPEWESETRGYLDAIAKHQTDALRLAMRKALLFSFNQEA